VLGRSLRWLRDELPFVLVIGALLAATAYLYLFHGHWRRGTAAMGAALLLAAVLRIVLPAPRVGMLNVRGRWLDTVCYFALGVVILGVDIRLH
jgi:sugar phosphate permease